MRINFSPDSGTFNHQPNWLTNIEAIYLKDYDINPQSKYAYLILTSTQGVDYFQKWLASNGYKVTYWEIMLTDHAQKPYAVAFGLEFADDCEKLVELKLKYS